ncbi:signal recognition particle receptor subunit alpha, partial [Tremellales sp. Uapishka_1]
MLDHVSISHQSGLVLWSKSFTPTFASLAVTPASPINSLIREGFIEGKSKNGETDGFEKDGYSVRWSMENGLGLVVFPALLPLTYIPALLERTKQLFISLFQPYLDSLIALSDNAFKVLQQKIKDERWDRVFERCLKNCEDRDGSKKNVRTPGGLHRQVVDPSASGASSPGQSDDSSTPLSAEEIAKNVHALKGRMKKPKGRGRGEGPSPSPSPSRKSSSNTTATAKLMRKWGDSKITADDMAALDYSSPAPDSDAPVDLDGLVSSEAMGSRSKSGLYEVADWDYKNASAKAEDLPSEEEILARRTASVSLGGHADDDGSGSAGGWGGMFARLTGKKVLTKEDLRPVLAEMEKHLMGKNVAKDIAEKLCESVGEALVGKKLGGFSSIKSEVQASLSSSITRILTPKTSTDLLLDIQRKKASPSTIASVPDPYTLTFVGVNGVGKSTNLSKVCFWLLQNGHRVLIAACDTFRSGAVEQLRVHVRNLGALSGGGIELYERGYGKDAAGIAKDAIAFAKENKFDVVLIDTAGRMQDNEPLMRALAKLVTVNNPDKIIFVGEALVGNEAVDQLSKFDRALKDFSGTGIGRKRGIDGIILTKFDTIDDKVGAALSMTYVTGQPILFVGCGQTYTDLRQLKVGHIVQALLGE